MKVFVMNDGFVLLFIKLIVVGGGMLVGVVCVFIGGYIVVVVKLDNLVYAWGDNFVG